MTVTPERHILQYVPLKNILQHDAFFAHNLSQNKMDFVQVCFENKSIKMCSLFLYPYKEYDMEKR